MPETNRKALLKPFQLLTLAAAFGVFVLLIVLLTLRRIDIGLIAGGAVFIITLVVLAMLVLSYKPNVEATAYLDRFSEPTPDAATDDAATPAARETEREGAPPQDGGDGRVDDGHPGEDAERPGADR